MHNRVFEEGRAAKEREQESRRAAVGKAPEWEADCCDYISML